MRQVPTGQVLPIGIVGDGRLARHFLHYCQLLALPVRQWSRRTSTCTPPVGLESCETVLLLIRDDAIVPFVDQWPDLRKKRLIHCSGSLVTSLAVCAHPLMAFSDQLYDLGTYSSVVFAVDAGATLPELIPGLPNRFFAIPPSERAYYHALCVLAGNVSTMLWVKLFDEFERRFGVDASAAHPFLKQITANLLDDPRRALTGPFSRGDRAAIEANLRALEGDPFQAVYAAVAGIYGYSA
jgi:2-dehydropantoate 2-reductase